MRDETYIQFWCLLKYLLFRKHVIPEATTKKLRSTKIK